MACLNSPHMDVRVVAQDCASNKPIGAPRSHGDRDVMSFGLVSTYSQSMLSLDSPAMEGRALCRDARQARRNLRLYDQAARIISIS